MNERSRVWAGPRVLFAAAIGATVAVAATTIVRTAAFARRPDLLSLALATDLCVMVPLAWAWLMVRPGLARPRTVLLVVALGALCARLVLPASEASVALGARLLGLVPEVALVGYGIARLRRRRVESPARGAGRNPDLLEALEESFAPLGPGGRVLAYEVATLTFALSPRRRPAPPAPAALSTDARGWGALLAALCLAAVVETVPVHVLVAHWSVRAAWVLTAASAYAVVWLVGDCRALSARATTVEDGTLRLRVGLRWRADIPLDRIESAERADWRSPPADGYLNTLRPLAPQVILRLHGPVSLRGPFGVRRSAHVLGLRLHEPETLLDALNRPATR